MKRLTLAFGVLFAAACGSSGSGGSPSSSTPNTTTGGYGLLSVRLGASSSTTSSHGNPHGNADLKEAIVPIDHVSAHVAGGEWVRILDRLVVLDLLKLEAQSSTLGLARLPAGEVTQIRLHVSSSQPAYVTTAAGDHVPLKVPSGMQSGIKVDGPWHVEACASSTVTLELEGRNALRLHATGHEDLWILRPVIHAGLVRTSTICDADDPDANVPPPPMTPPSSSGTSDPGPDGVFGTADDGPGATDPGATPSTGPGSGGPGADCSTTADCDSTTYCNQAHVCTALNL